AGILAGRHELGLKSGIKGAATTAPGSAHINSVHVSTKKIMDTYPLTPDRTIRCVFGGRLRHGGVPWVPLAIQEARSARAHGQNHTRPVRQTLCEVKQERSD